MPSREEILPLVSALRKIGTQSLCRATSGNFSQRIQGRGIFITRSGIQKSDAAVEDFLLLDGEGNVLEGESKPSAETGLHLLIYSKEAATNVVLHTHSFAGTVLSRALSSRGAKQIKISGYEFQKAVDGFSSHESELAMPLFSNSQDITALAEEVAGRWEEAAAARCFYLAGHGLYTWAATVDQAYRQVDALEFLLECELEELKLRLLA